MRRATLLLDHRPKAEAYTEKLPEPRASSPGRPAAAREREHVRAPERSGSCGGREPESALGTRAGGRGGPGERAPGCEGPRGEGGEGPRETPSRGGPAGQWDGG